MNLYFRDIANEMFFRSKKEKPSHPTRREGLLSLLAYVTSPDRREQGEDSTSQYRLPLVPPWLSGNTFGVAQVGNAPERLIPLPCQ